MNYELILLCISKYFAKYIYPDFAIEMKEYIFLFLFFYLSLKKKMKSLKVYR